MKTITLNLLMLLVFFQMPAKLKLTDFNLLLGKKWTGTLTYLDYGNGKLQIIPTTLTVTSSAKGEGVYDFTTTYPQESGHDSVDETIIAKDGGLLDKEKVKERVQLANGDLKIMTTAEGIDNDKKALFRFTYYISKNVYQRKKEVCYVGTTHWFMRNDLNLKAN